MDEKLVNLIIGSLLHDIGKIIHRTGVMATHSHLGWEFLSELTPIKGNKDIKECIKYHHGRDLSNSKVKDNSLAYLTYVADNISASGDRRMDIIEGEENINRNGALFDKTAPLESVFNILNGNKEKFTYHFKMLDKINYPVKERYPYSTANYSEIKVKLKEQLEGIKINKDYINSILHLLEATTSFIPSSTNTKELMDISFFDHSKTTAAIASCLYYYLDEVDYKTKILKEKELRQENGFLLYSCDISGIQSYIYSISGTEALKSLRARSLYLELLMENILDELLFQTGLSRCNLIYTGGGHGYLLLPNTNRVKEILHTFEKELKLWFLNNFEISLFIASGYTECNSNELSEDIGKVYERVSKNISIKKSQRYTANDIIKLNSSPPKTEERECRECKKTGPTSQDGKCEICQSLIEMSPQVINQDTFFVVSHQRDKTLPRATLPLPFGQVLAIKNIEKVRGSDYIRVYSKNQPSMGYNFATNLWVGDYSVKSNIYRGVKTFDEFAKESMGISRIAILRADVDNLGRAFTSGFNEKKKTISRTATLSRQLSMFFKYYINAILETEERNSLIVYSGGDDMFIVGSWNEIIDLAKDIRQAFIKYTQGTLTLSAGIGIFNHSFPISRIASDVGELEEAAKIKDENKNKVTLFRKAKVDQGGKTLEEDWIIEWDQLPRIRTEGISKINDEMTISSGIEGKLRTLERIFSKDAQQGKAFLYKILELLRESKKDKINIARYAYLLKRAKKDNPKLDISKFYKYILNKKDSKELEIAITLYSYLTRN